MDADAIVLGGGGDIAPWRYGCPDAAAKVRNVDERRDELEFRLGQYCLDHRIPILGICRGLQVIQVLGGGRLTPDLDEPLREIHEANGPSDRAHAIEWIESTESGAALKHLRWVNSAHHQAIVRDGLGSHLRIAAVAADGTVEAIESSSAGPPIYAVQWHPERPELWQRRDSASLDLRDFWIARVSAHAPSRRRISPRGMTGISGGATSTIPMGTLTLRGSNSDRS